METIDQFNQKITFFTLIETESQVDGARLLVNSLRTFGGDMHQCPFWVFVTDPELKPGVGLRIEGVRIIDHRIPDMLANYWFSAKVSACARAEELAESGVQSLVWLSPDCLVVKPPDAFQLEDTIDIALRPVHIRNIGSLFNEPLDAYWQGIYQALQVEDPSVGVKSFVDGVQLRPYYNSHAMSIRPSLGLFKRWLFEFGRLVNDYPFQSGPCQDDLHRIFLHQAVLSTLIASLIDRQQIRILSPDYSYPYNLHEQVPDGKRAQALDDLVCFTYEDRPLNPNLVHDVEIGEPLRSWIIDQIE